MKKYTWLILGLIIATISSCDLINPAEPIPVYLEISEFEVEATQSVNTGSLNSKIEQAYVYAGPDLIGLYTLPATVPVLLTGDIEVNLDPVIRANGSILTLRSYPFYERYITTVNLNAGETAKIDPVTKYRDNITVFFEDFDNSALIFNTDRDGDDATILERQTDDVFEGTGSGRIVLTKDHPLIEVATSPTSAYDLGDISFAYLEVNYKSEIPLAFGLIGLTGSEALPNYEYGINSKDEWNKIYFDLGELITLSGLDFFQLGIFAALPTEDGEFSVDEAEILLDNIKLVYF